MKIIVPVAVAAILLLDFAGAVPDSSVGGPMTLLLACFVAALVVGMHEAWSNGRGFLGWIVSGIAALIGGFVGVSAFGMIMESVLVHLNLEGSLASTRHPLLYVASAGMMLITLLGSWLALLIAGRLR